jgi:hypothetical protein
LKSAIFRAGTRKDNNGQRGKTGTPEQSTETSDIRLRCRPARRLLATFKERLLARSLAPLTPALIGSPGEMSASDAERAARTAAQLVCRGPLEVMFAVLGSVLVLNLLSLASRGKRFGSLKRRQQMDLLAGAFNSRFMLVRGASVLAGLPLKVAYYNRDDVCRDLGFDRGLLIEDALAHQVTRGT